MKDFYGGGVSDFTSTSLTLDVKQPSVDFPLYFCVPTNEMLKSRLDNNLRSLLTLGFAAHPLFVCTLVPRRCLSAVLL